MKRFIALLGLSMACAGTDTSTGVVSYANNDLQLAVGNGAFFTCSCIFTMEMPEDFCRAWVKASPDVARIGIDYSAKTVESSAFVSWSAKAHWVDNRRGCVLE